MNSEEVFHQMVLLYTETKMELAQRMKEGICYSEFIDYEKRLEKIDQQLRRQEDRLKRFLLQN